jgi:hypothetical protein
MRLLSVSVLIAGFALLYGLGTAEAVCGGSSPNRLAASASRTDVNDCVTAAASGDTITVPAGSASWSSAIALPGNKSLTIVGATVITCSGGEGTTAYACTSGGPTTALTCSGGCFTLNLAASHTVARFTMTNSGSSEIITCNVGNQGASTRFRVHHSHLISTGGWNPTRCYGDSNAVHPQGIWDHNRIEDVALHANGTDWNLDEASHQDAIWAQQPGIGNDSSGVVFTEANHVVRASTNFTDGNYGCRRVERFNHIADPATWDFEIHGMQGGNRGCQRIEVYHNATSGGTSGGFSEMRGGTGVYFNNKIPSGRTGINLTIDRSEYDEPSGNFEGVRECGAGGADGNSPSGVDQQTPGRNGWRCRDQVGTWYDATQWSHTPMPGGPPWTFSAWNQVSRPVYIWGNTAGSGAMGISVNGQGDIESKIVVNREFYCDGGLSGGACAGGVGTGPLASRPATCTAGVAFWVTDRGKWRKDTPSNQADGVLHRCVSTNTWAAYYIPYPYPHPWIDGNTSFVSNPNFSPGGGSAPGAPSSLTVTP